MGADNSGADTFRVKNSYIDFKLGEQRFTVGVQDFMLARGYIYNDDGSGIKAMFKVNDAIYLPLIYMKMYEGGSGYASLGNANSNYDWNAYIFYPTIFLNKDNTLKPHVAYMTSQDGFAGQAKNTYIAADYQVNPNQSGVRLPIREVNIWSAGLEYDGKIGIFDLGATAVMEFGDVKLRTDTAESSDLKGYLFDLFGGVNLGPANIHAKGIYASGDSERVGDTDTTIDRFVTFGPKTNWGTSYYWAEIMGAGIIDNQVPNGAPGDKITNVWIGNFGASYKLLADLKFAADLWYAQHAEDVRIAPYTVNPNNQTYSKSIGTELDLVATYTIVDNLKLDLIGAYLWADDCITKANDPNGGANPVELAAQLSLAF
jgi:hypothetical protein